MKLQLLDSNGILMPCIYALPEMFNPDGLMVNGLFGYCRCVLKLLKNKNNCVIASFDKCPRNIRKQICPNYKKNRPPLDPCVKIQIELATEFCNQLELPMEFNEYYEADDIIASYARKYYTDHDVEIFSIDKDLCQLINEKTKIVHPFKKIIMDTNYVIEKYGVQPKDFHLFLSMVGDASDNIVGIRGIGPKTAANIINNYPDPKDWKKHFAKFDFSSLDQMLELTKLYDVPINHIPCKIQINIEAGRNFLNQMGFFDLLDRL